MAERAKLTQKQRRFVELYTAIGTPTFGNGLRSAREAGYKGSEGTLCSVSQENLRKPLIAAAIEAANAQHTNEVKLTAVKVLGDLEETRQAALQAGNFSAAAKCSELQGKYLKIWVDRVEHTMAIEDMGEDELDRLLAEATSELAVKQSKMKERA